MEESLRLKEEADSLVVGSDGGNAAVVLKPDADSADLHVTEVNPVQIIQDSAAQREVKKLADQAFLEIYKKDERRSRIRFGAILLLLIACFGFGVPKFFEYTDHARKVSAHFIPAVGSAMIGEKDAAYFQTSNFPLSGDDAYVSSLVNVRKKILDHSIAELEDSGRSALFSRLGGEQLLMRAGEREKGLAYGDFLLQKNPTLPSNYCFRAHVDFEVGNFNQSVAEYEQFLTLLKDSSPKTREAWAPQIREAVWACINSGQTDKAKMFLRTYEEYGGTKYDMENYVNDHTESNVSQLNRAILLAQYNQLDIPELRKTIYWTPELERYSAKILRQAQSVELFWSPYYLDSDLASLDMNLRSGDFQAARKALEQLNKFDFHRYRYTIGAAELALASGEPKTAIEALEKYLALNQGTSEINLLLANAFQQMHSSELGLKYAELGLAEYKQNPLHTYTGKFFLPLLMTKALLLSDSGRFQQALQLCDQLIAANNGLVAPRLLKIQIMEKQHSSQEEINELRAKLSAFLKKLST